MTDAPTLAAAEISLSARVFRFVLRVLVCAVIYCVFAGLIYVTEWLGEQMGYPKLGIIGLGIDVIILCELMIYFRKRLGSIMHALGPVLALLVVILLFGVIDVSLHGRHAAFWSTSNLRMVAMQTSPIAVAALGMTLVIIAGGIDLSAGTAVALCATVLAWCLDAESTASLSPGTRVAVAVTACTVMGCVTGAINGSLISLLRVVPFIITLGAMTVYLGAGKLLSGATPIRPNPNTIPAWIPNLVDPTPALKWVSWPLLPNFASGVWLVLLLAIFTAALLHLTVFGRHVFAIGSNESTARLCGINVPLTKIAVYSLTGLFVGIAGLYQFARLSAGNPTSGIGLELKIIAAVVIGGGSLSGGQGSVVGTLCGAAIMLVIGSGCTMLGMQNAMQDIVIGGIIVAAVAVDQLRQRRMGG